MPPNYLPLAIKNTGMSLQEVLPELLRASSPKLSHYLFVCKSYRQLGVGELLISNDPEPFYSRLYKSAQAFVHFLKIGDNAEKATSQAYPFFDAVACGAEDVARKIALLCPDTINLRKEYEEDFLYYRILMKAFYLAAPDSEIQDLLDEFESYHDQNPDERFELCKALIDKDQESFDEALSACVQALLDSYGEQKKASRLNADEAATLSHVSPEVLAWLLLARKQGLTVAAEYQLAPSTAQKLHLAVYPPADSWKQIESFTELS
ncbi:immunity 49 family protein [Hahella ganghwensis]|uniref:immunity 49 family protein n=1 Tax=Hahella ganghwensis TaxID=286420 RepID=UPI000372F91D|nr:immunity 49 family protein [Hahella ganghwensis]